MSGSIKIWDCRLERWPLAQDFKISRGSKAEATVVVAEVTDGQHMGRGECTPYERYGENITAVMAQIHGYTGSFDHDSLLEQLPAGAARNALDCALWDLEAKAAGQRIWQLLGCAPQTSFQTYYTDLFMN